jgi:hypothetical protein
MAYRLKHQEAVDTGISIEAPRPRHNFEINGQCAAFKKIKYRLFQMNYPVSIL